MKRPVFLLLILNLLIGLLTFQDYGLSWDEPLFYEYADAVPYAYSIRARLSGNFDIEQAYGPSGDHKMYGPAYLLPAEALVDLLDAALPVERAALWHLVNFLTFQVGVLFFYALCKRWMSAWAALGAALLFSTQPVLWGHAFINPKDMPFMVFFIAAMFLGFRMVDRLSPPEAEVTAAPGAPRPERWRKARRVFQALALIGLALSLAAILFSTQWENLLGSLVHNAYTAAPDTLLGRLFGRLAANAGDVLEEAYTNKALILFARLKTALAALTALLLICAGLLTFWLGGLQRTAAWLGERLAPLPTWPDWWIKGLSLRRLWLPVLLAGIALGLLISIRVVGPLAGLLVGLHFFLRAGRRPLAGLVAYGAVAIIAMLLTWPYLWASPLQHLAEVFRHMSNNPQILSVVFNGAEYPSNALPVCYLPLMLAITLTLPVWPLFFGGLAAAAGRIARKDAAPLDWRSLTALLAWFVLMLAYVLILRPPMYDGYRHFLFILPPVFVFAGLAFQFVLERSRRPWLNALLLALVALPGILALVRLHPYQYTYYNALVGGTGGASHRFETDYWLTCYKEAMEQVNAGAPEGITLFVQRQPEIAQVYARPGLTILPFDMEDDQTFPGSLLLLSSRTNVDEKVHLEAPAMFTVGRDGAVFCVIKQIP